MKLIITILFLSTTFIANAQKSPDFIDIMNWRLELPSGYKASDWKLSNFRKDRFAKPFFYLDSLDGALVMEAYPIENTKSTAKYLRNTLREQMQPRSNDVNWTKKQGGTLKAELQVMKMSQENGKYHKTILFQLDGRTSDKQTTKMGLEKPVNIPLFKITWQDGRIKIQRKILKNESTVGDQLFRKEAWEKDEPRFVDKKVGFEKFEISITAKKGKIEIRIDDEPPVIYRDTSVKQWYFENYFTAGNYLQTKSADAHSIVKYYYLKVTHD
ncbi:MAG: polysaccharide lyase family 7 protein [Cyclobacteriaceae bacterium]